MAGGDALQHPALLNEGVVGGQGGQLREDVAGDQNGGLPLPVQLEKQLPELHDALWIQAVDRLIQQEIFRVVHQCQGQAQRCFMPREKVLNFFFPVSVSRTCSRGLVHALFSGDAPLDAVVLQVLAGGEVGVEGRDLHHGPGAGAARFKAAGSVARTGRSPPLWDGTVRR